MMLAGCSTSDDIEAAWTTSAGLLEVLNEEGMNCILSASAAQRAHWRRALASLATPPTSLMLAESFAEKCFAALGPSVQRYRTEMSCEEGGEPTISTSGQVGALNRLFVDFMTIHAMLEEWCQALQVPEAVGLLAVSTRCELLQSDLLSGEVPKSKGELMKFLWRYGCELLEQKHDAAEDEDEDGDGANALSLHGAVHRNAAASKDPVLQCLHGLTLSATPDIKELWRCVLETCVNDKIQTLEEEYSEHYIEKYLRWAEEVVEPFIRAALCGETNNSHVMASSTHRHGQVESDAAARSEVERWCAEFKHRLVVSYARKRIAMFWDILVEFPDSMAALEDIQYALRCCGSEDGSLKEELISHLRHLLASRLHRAGTRTEDILAILSKAIHALSVLLSRNEQSGVILSVIADTLTHLRRRKDCVAAVVNSLTQTGGDSLLHYDATAHLYSSGAEDGHGEADFKGPARGGGPDVLRILLTAIPVKALTEEYRRALASQLLAKEMHSYDTSTEEEVLERLKCVLGEDVLPNCVVMVHDMQASRRVTQHMRNHFRSSMSTIMRETLKDLPQPNIPADDVSVNVLSMSAWPKLGHCQPANEPAALPDTYTVHPQLQYEMHRLSHYYKHLKVGQKLVWILSQGRTTLEMDMKDPDQHDALVKTSFTLSLFTASVALHITEEQQYKKQASVPVRAIAAKMEVPPATVLLHVQHLVPNLFVLLGEEGIGRSIALQTHLARSSHVVFEEEEKNAKADELSSSGMSAEQTQMMGRMITAMLKTRGAVSLNDIHNSMKMFAQFPGSVADMKRLLLSLVASGTVVVTDAKLYALPR